MNKLYELLQIEQTKKWQLIKRIKNYFKTRTIRKQIKESLQDRNQFFDNIKDFCFFIENSLPGLGIEKPSGIACRVIPYKNKSQSFIFIFGDKIDNATSLTINLTINRNEEDRIDTKLSFSTENSKSVNNYNMYIYKDLIELYNKNTPGSEGYKGLAIDRTINCMQTIISTLIKEIYIKYIKPSKKGTLNEKETE